MIESNGACLPMSIRERSSTVPELTVFAVLLAVLNFPLLMGRFAGSMIFLPDVVRAGEWWRVATHPFVHLSWYHLVLDAGAFLLLYGGLEECGRGRRLITIIGCGAGSLGLSLLTSPVVQSRGLCGLSGIAHGLMAFSALESLGSPTADRRARTIGLFSFVVVAGKSLLEMLQGHVFFEFLHFGLMGVPVPACHAGGVLAGTMLYIFMNVGQAKHWFDIHETC
jgi:rhomboid family GlyGly-CTERM serine protease